MYPPIFATVAANSTVLGLLGSSPTRFFLFGEAPPDVTKPYAVWQIVGGLPENYLGTLPDLDGYTTLVDVYATSASSAREVADAIRDAVEPVAHIVSWGGESRDRETKNYRFSFDIDWKVNR